MKTKYYFLIGLTFIFAAWLAGCSTASTPVATTTAPGIAVAPPAKPPVTADVPPVVNPSGTGSVSTYDYSVPMRLEDAAKSPWFPNLTNAQVAQAIHLMAVELGNSPIYSTTQGGKNLTAAEHIALVEGEIWADWRISANDRVIPARILKQLK